MSQPQPVRAQVQLNLGISLETTTCSVKIGQFDVIIPDLPLTEEDYNCLVRSTVRKPLEDKRRKRSVGEPANAEQERNILLRVSKAARESAEVSWRSICNWRRRTGRSRRPPLFFRTPPSPPLPWRPKLSGFSRNQNRPFSRPQQLHKEKCYSSTLIRTILYVHVMYRKL